VSRSFEPLIEWTIRLCGWSAIFFVFGILFFVFREAAPALTSGLNLKEFFTSQNWRPDSTIQPQFGILALMAGTASVTLLAMAIAVPDQKMALVVPWSSRAVLLERSDATDPMASGSSTPGALPQPRKTSEDKSVREPDRRDSNCERMGTNLSSRPG